MARTAVGAQLTEQHKAAQVALRAVALRAFMALWPVWTGDGRTFRLLVDAVLPLILAQHQTSAGLAARYFDAFRFAERAPGTARAVAAAALEAGRVAGALYTVGRDMTGKAIAAGQTPQAAMQTALVRTSGTVGTLVMEGGRETLLRSTERDPAAPGWARVSSSECCAFCAMLASRGAVFGEDSGAFEAHDHCACSLEPAYPGTRPTPNAQAFRDLWDREAKPAGADALQAFRRALAAERSDDPA